MALNGLAFIQANNSELLPHIEEAALKYVMNRYVMPSRVRVATDMIGWNVRKISEYLPARRAQELAEDTEIADTTLVRARLSEVSPKEIGDRYRVSNRRSTTDPESILADTIEALGKGIGDKVENDLLQQALTSFRDLGLGGASTDLSLPILNAAAFLFQTRRKGDPNMFHVAHRYQTLPIITDLLTISNSESGQAALANAGVAQNLRLPTIGELAFADMHPRRVIYKLSLYGGGGTFRLMIGNGYSLSGADQNITAAITVTGVDATDATAIAAALNALPVAVRVGTWACAAGVDETDFTVTPPADWFVTEEDNLRPAIKYDEEVTIFDAFDSNLEKSPYDLITGLSGAPLDRNGAELGFTISERSATSYMLTFFRDALVYDIRQAIVPFGEMTMQGRTWEYSATHVYGVAGWRDYLGMKTLTTADSPTAVGA